MKEKMTLETLKNEAFAIEQGKNYKTTDCTDWCIRTEPCNNRGYSVNSGLCAFVDDNKFYVIPAHSDAIEILKENGFSPKSFYVPFSYPFAPEEPLWDRKKWKKIKAEAAEIVAEAAKKKISNS